MGWRHQYNNQRAKEQDQHAHIVACWALEDFRSQPETNAYKFPDLRKWVMRRCYGNDEPNLNLSGYGFDDVNPRLTIEEYRRFEEAYKATEAGKADPVYATRQPDTEKSSEFPAE